MKVLNIGCGRRILECAVNLDICPFPGVQVVHDIEKTWPFDVGSFDRIIAHHVLEHCRNLVFVMNEANCCLAPEGEIEIKVPWWSGEWAHGDPTHVRFFDHNSFSPFSDWWPEYRYLGIQRWVKVSQEYFFRKDDENSALFAKLGFSTCQYMVVVLRKF